MSQFLFEDAKLDSMRKAILDKGYDNATVDLIIAMDSQSRNGGAGQVAKSLLLPKFIEGETDFINYPNDVSASINTYYQNRANYPNEAKNVGNFQSVKQFLDFVIDPANVTIGSGQPAEEVDPIKQLYNKYYNAIPLDIYSQIISADPTTVIGEPSSRNKIGEIAKTLYLTHYLRVLKNEEEDFLQMIGIDKLKQAADKFVKNRKNLPKDKQQLSSYVTVQDFIDEMLNANATSDDPYVASVLNYRDNVTGEAKKACENEDGNCNKDTLVLIAETPNWAVWWPKNHAAGAVITNGGWDNQDYQQSWWQKTGLSRQGTIGFKWCTTSVFSDTGYFSNYSCAPGTADNEWYSRLYSFIHKAHAYPKNRTERAFSVQARIAKADYGKGEDSWSLNYPAPTTYGSGYSFLNGSDESPRQPKFENFLLANSELIDALKDIYPFNKCVEFQAAASTLEKFTAALQSKDGLVINSYKDWFQLRDYTLQGVQGLLKKVTIGPDIKVIPAGVFSGAGITSIHIPANVTCIKAGAFEHCVDLSELTFDEGVAVIEAGAFFGCKSLKKKSVILPNSLSKIGKKAFYDTNCTIKVKQSRISNKLTLNVDTADKEWFNSTVEVVKGV